MTTSWRPRIWTRIFTAAIVGALGVGFIARGVSILGGRPLFDGQVNVVGGTLYLMGGLLMIAVEVGLLVFMILLRRRMSRTKADRDVE